MVDLATREPGLDGTDKKCPLLDNPHPECFCLKLNGLNVPQAVHFCLQDFRNCPVYRRLVEITGF